MKVKETIVACALAAAIAVAPLAGCTSQGESASSSADSSSATASEESSQVASAASVGNSDGDVEYVLYLGTNDKDTNEPVYPRDESKERAKAILMKDFGGYTIQEAEGGWRGDDGTEYQEYTLVIYLSDTDLDSVHAAARELIDEFHQSSVLINTQSVQTEFYDGE